MHKPLDQPQEGRKQQEERIQHLSLGKGDLKHNKFKKIMKRQRNTTQMKQQARNTEVQIKEEERGKLPEKVFRIMVLKMFLKTLKTKWRKCKNQLTNT